MALGLAAPTGDGHLHLLRVQYDPDGHLSKLVILVVRLTFVVKQMDHAGQTELARLFR